jgi:hypothetical protein
VPRAEELPMVDQRTSEELVPEIPGIPYSVLRAAIRRELVVFVGAGASTLAGGPTWSELADKLLDKLHLLGVLKYSEKSLLGALGPKEKLSIAVLRATEREVISDIDFKELFTPGTSDEHLEGLSVYTHLRSMRCGYITTNYDDFLRNAPTPLNDINGVEKGEGDVPESMPSDSLEPIDITVTSIAPHKVPNGQAVVHLHGVAGPKMIMTSADYIRHYRIERVQKLLRYIFEHFTVLFVGYSASEIEVLEHVLRNWDDVSDQEESSPRHCLLYPMYRYQSEAVPLMESYYNSLDVELRPYCRDTYDYRQLIHVTHEWARQIRTDQLKLVDKIHRLEDIFARHETDTDAVSVAIGMTVDDPDLVPHLFRLAKGKLLLEASMAMGNTGWYTPSTLKDESYARDYLVRMAEECETANDRDLAGKLLTIYRDVTSDPENCNETVRPDMVDILTKIPVDMIVESNLEPITNWLTGDVTGLIDRNVANKLLPYLIASHSLNSPALCVELVRIVTSINFTEVEIEQHRIRDLHTAVAFYHLHQTFTEQGYASKLGEKCGLEVVTVLVNQLIGVFRNDESYDRLSVIWRPAIEEHTQNRHGEDVRTLFVSAIRDTLLGCINGDTYDEKAVRSLLTDWILGESVTLRRIAIHVLDVRFDAFHDFLPEVLEQHFFEVDTLHEMYHLLRNHFNDEEFAKHLRTETIDLIDGLTVEDNDKDAEMVERWTKIRRRRWFHAIREVDDRAKERYEYYHINLGGDEPEHPDLSSWMGDVEWIAPLSAINSSDMLQVPLHQLVTDLNGIDPQSGIPGPEGERLSIEGTRKALTEAVKSNPEHFWRNSEALRQLDDAYPSAIIDGFTEVWENDGDIEWQAVLDIGMDLIHQNGFWEDDGKEYGRRAIVSAIAALFRVGMLRDENPLIDIGVLNQIEEALRIMLTQLKSGTGFESDGAVMRAINSSRGQLIESLFLYTRRLKLTLGEEREREFDDIWESRLAPLFTKQLERDGDTTGDYEFRALACNHAQSLLYFNRSWLIDHVDEIFDCCNDVAWHAAMDGYSHLSTVYEVLYRSLRERKHLHRAIDEDYHRDRIVQKIAIAYAAGWERLDDDESTIRYVLDKWEADDLYNIVSLFWRNHDEKEPDAELNRMKIPALNLWEWCFDHFPDDSESRPTILVRLSDLAVYLDEITERHRDWLIAAASEMQDGWSGSQLIEELARLAEMSPENTATVFLAFFGGERPPYPDKDIQALLQTLKSKGLNDQVANILEAYARAGIDPNRLGPALSEE